MGKTNHSVLTAGLAIAVLSPAMNADRPVTLATPNREASLTVSQPRFQSVKDQTTADLKAQRQSQVSEGSTAASKAQVKTLTGKKETPADGYAVPYHKDFPTLASLDEMTIIDANKDDSTWGWDQYQKYARLSCPQNGDDDWLISAPIKLEAGKIYDFASLVSAGNPSAFPPMLEIFVGNAPEVNAMTIPIVPKFQISKYDTNLTGSFEVPADGKYYIGVHGCSTEYLALIKFMYFDVTGGAVKDGPGIPADALIEPDWSARTNTVNISFKAPTLTGGGKPLSAISKIEIIRNGSVIKTFANPVPGEKYAFTDDAGAPGDYTYAIIGYNEAGLGGKFEKTISVGAKGKSIPYLEDFSKTIGYDEELTFIDNNNDGTSFWHATQTNPPYAWITFGENTPTTDDYLITPSLSLEENTVYAISADMWGYGEGAEILAGTAPKVDALTSVVVSHTFLGNDQATYDGRFTTTYGGNYYVAIHAKADKRYTDFHVTNISVKRVGAATAPDLITGLTINPKGDNGLSFSFQAPIKSVEGKTIQKLDKIVVKRGNTEVKTFDAPAAGATLSFDDVPGVKGEVEYSFISYGDGKEGARLDHVAFISKDVPAMPQNVKAEYVGGGKMKVSWTPVTTSAHGVNMNVKGYVLLEVKDGANRQFPITSATEFTYDAIDPEDQSLIYYGVFPANEAGEYGDYGLSNTCFAGNPYKLSYKESFADAAMHSIIRIENIIFQPEWALANSGSFSDVQPSDGDNGMVAMKGGMNASGRLSTGMIDLSTNAVNPALTFNVYNIDPDEYTNEIYVDIREVGSDEWEQVAGYVIKDLSKSKGWVRVVTDLSKYKGKNIHVGLRPVGHMYLWTIFDAIRVSNLTDNDLEGTIQIFTPTVMAGEGANVTLTASNNGQKNASVYTMELYKNGKLAASKEYKNLKAGESKSVTFNMPLGVQDEDNVEFYGKVMVDGDTNLSDNVTKKVSIEVAKPVYPEPRDLKANQKDGVELTWLAPSMDNVAPSPYTETFETAPSWNQKGANDWTFIDLDNTPSGGFNQFTFPGITSGETVTSFFVIDKNESALGQYGSLFEGVNGSAKTLGALLCYNQNTSNDWAISPELYGGRQIVRFYTKALLGSYPETFQCYYSTGSLKPDDFIPVGTPTTFSNDEDWTEMSLSLPVGAKRFAIRRISASGALMMVDDVTLRLAGGEPEQLKLVGYNVYCDGKLLNSSPVEATTYPLTADLEDGKHSFAVTAVYEQGESNSVRSTLEVSALDEISYSAVNVWAEAGKIEITGAAGLKVSVYGIDGRTIYSGNGSDSLTIAANRGICIVHVGNRLYKVMVK